ncbi:helix-hairpin-helix domain-containing protein [Sulfurimonas sp.]|uniref:ComEA family DNA-binding protein n=1 Tax=Sulfurimonas sp. TaxID=2022749 RepID=UPI00263634BD|nr:helix-hairpin-helix domain-containing protein [Sulfurimonas sp.]MCW8895361.1 helix-hairpin-helix domain-containing protein [Sulfurimonas sp.]MCW9067504.1 helix-hairpin-helix domain-containing protein [Sulfurimonas sp.]
MKILAMIFLGVSLLLGAVDINTADVKELSGLSGVGAKKADAIIEFRAENCFKSIDELAKVKGIGKKTVEKNRDNLTASACKK